MVATWATESKVTYQADHFFDKNKDYMVAEHKDLLNASKCSFVADLFPPLPVETSKSSKSSPIGSHFKSLVKVDPIGRYDRYNKVLGKRASKTVYRAFNEYEGMELAWNQVKLYDFLQSPDDLERLYCEIHLLKNLTHRNTMKFYASWVDITNRNINFVTEMFMLIHAECVIL